MAVLTPDGLARKTMREILAEHDADGDDDIVIGVTSYHQKIMESDYDESYQISAAEGDLVFFTFITYGYGDTIAWSKLEARKKELEEWAIGMCERHHCFYEICVSANYW